MIVFNELRITRDAKNLMIDAEVRPGEHFKNVYIKGVTIDTEETYVEGGPSDNPIYSKSFDTVKYLKATNNDGGGGSVYTTYTLEDEKPDISTGQSYLKIISKKKDITITIDPSYDTSLCTYDGYGYGIKINGKSSYLLSELAAELNRINQESRDNYGIVVSGAANSSTFYFNPIPAPSYSFDLTLSKVKSISLTLNEADLVTTLSQHLFFVYVETEGTPDPGIPCGMDNTVTLGVTMYMGNYYNSLMQYMKEMSDSDCSVPQGLINQMLQWKALNLSIDSGHYLQGIKYFNKWFSGKLKAVPISKCGCNG